MAVSDEAAVWLAGKNIRLLPWQGIWWEAQESGNIVYMGGGIATGKTFVLRTYADYLEEKKSWL